MKLDPSSGKDLNKQGIRISYGSVWNVLNTYKRQYEHSNSERSSQLNESQVTKLVCYNEPRSGVSHMY